MSDFISKVSRHRAGPDRFLDNRPFPLIGAAVGLIAVVNVVSAAAMLLSV